MLRKTHTFARAVFALAALALAAPAAPPRAEGNEPAPVKLGATVEGFRLPDAAGREHTLASLRGKAGTVIIFVSTRCPVSNMYNERMRKLAEDYKAKGVHVVGINSNAPEPADEIRQHAAEKGLAFPILKDSGARVADRLGATRTPEAFLLDAQNRLVYHGALDNAQNPVMVNTHHLRNAVDAVLAGKTVERPEVKAFGCTIKRG